MMKIGWASREFTPDRPAMLQGQMHRRIARAAKDPLTVTALAIEGGTPLHGAILVSCDVPYIHQALWDGVRERLRAAVPEVPAEAVVMNATHTHTAPVMEDGFYEPPGDAVMTPAECEARIADAAAAAAAAAWRARTPRRLGRAFGHAVVGHNRHAVYADGHAQMYGHTDQAAFRHIGGYEDHGVDMLFTWDTDGGLAGIVLAVPCPSQVEENLEVFSADYWHDVRLELRRRLGPALAILPLCAPAGDQSPHFLLYGAQEAEMRRRRGLTERQEIAQRLADAVERALACTPPPPTGADDVPFAHRLRRLTLTPRRVLKPERDWAAAELARWAEARGETTSWWPQNLQRVVRIGDGALATPPVPVELHLLRLGDLALATNPFELFIDYGLQIKARSPAAQTMLVQIAGKGWYLPTERAVRGGGYGAMPAVSKVGPEGGQELVEATLETLTDLWRE